MRGLLVVLLLAFGVATSASAHPPTQVNADTEKGIADEIAAFRKAMAEAIRVKDVAALRRMYAETFQHIHTSAKSDGRDARIVSAIAGDPVIETAEVEDFKVHAHAGGWVAIVSATSPIKAISDGKTYAVRWTAVYVRTDTAWALAASQATRGAEIKPK
jgi:ketosteroid isomerase-like protein